MILIYFRFGNVLYNYCKQNEKIDLIFHPHTHPHNVNIKYVHMMLYYFNCSNGHR